MFEVLGPRHTGVLDRLERTQIVSEYQPVYILSSLRTHAYRQALSPSRGDPPAPVLRSPAPTVAVMAESALWFRCAGPALMAEQMSHLRRLADADHLDLAIIAAETIMPTPVGHAFHLYGTESVVVGIRGAKFISSDPELVGGYRTAFDALYRCAEKGPAAVRLIEAARVRYEEERDNT